MPGQPSLLSQSRRVSCHGTKKPFSPFELLTPWKNTTNVKRVEPAKREVDPVEAATKKMSHSFAEDLKSVQRATALAQEAGKHAVTVKVRPCPGEPAWQVR